MRDRGEIRSTKDFEKRLVDLASLIQKDKLVQRTPWMTFEEGELLESDAMRTWIEYVRMDLEAALGETERLSNSMRAHNRILAENYFRSLESAVSELEAETRAYEILENQKFSGLLSVVKRYTFDGATSVPSADNDDSFTSSLFVDIRANDNNIIYSPPDSQSGGIHLGTVGSVYEHKFDRVEVLTDSTTPQTAINTSTANNIPINAIDGSQDTAWRYSVLLTTQPDSCRLIFSPSFTGARRVSALVIHPLSDISMKLVSISYVDSGGKEIALPLGTSYAGTSGGLFDSSGPLGHETSRTEDWILPNTEITIPVGDIIARKFIITFQQDSGSDGDFFYDDGDLGSWVSDTSIEEYAQSGIIPRQEVFTELGFVDDPSDTRRQGRFYEFVFGLKDIFCVEREYSSSSLFVPESFNMTKAPSTLALYSDVKFPSGELTDVEFLMKKKNYASDGSLLDIETIPILAYGSSSIKERLFLSELHLDLVANDAGQLRFYPDFSQSFGVYRDGTTLLTVGSDYEISIDGGTTFETSLSPVATPDDPKRCIVRISGPQVGSIYTVSYTPLVSTSEVGGEVWLNADHTVRLGRNQIYVFERDRPIDTVTQCEIGLQIVLRANTLSTRVSPYLREAIILGGFDG
jgi:hypothetical protein